MSPFNESKSSNPPADPAAGSEVPPAMLSPDEAMQIIRDVQARISVPSGALLAMSRRRRLSHVDPRFVQAAVSAIGATPGVAQALERTDEDVRQELDADGRWVAVADEVRSLLQSILGANAVRRQRIGLLALQTYQICQQLARDTANEHLLVHVREMRRLNKFGRSRRKVSPLPDEVKTPPVTQ